mgnify:CR=1 FL=1
MSDPLPPSDIAAEESLIGSLVIDGQVLPRILPILAPDDFFREQNRWCYEAALALFRRSEAIDQVTLARELTAQGRLEQVGGHAYLGTLAAQVPTTLHAQDYAVTVRRMAVFRRMISVAGRIATLGYSAGPDSQVALQEAISLVLGIRGRSGTRSWTLAELLDQFLAIGPLAANEGQRTGAALPTGYWDLDALLGGLYPGNLVTLAARPSIGKSALALAITRNVAAQGRRVAFFSLEMSSEEVAQRLVSGESNVSLHRVRGGKRLSDDEESAVMNAVGALSELPVQVEDTPGMGLIQLQARLQALRADSEIALVVVDYLQLLRAPSRWNRNRSDEVTEVVQELKNLARETNIPFLVLSQLNRKPEGRLDHHPELSDLRESGAIEQESDVVMLIHREDFYVSEERWNRTHPLEPYPKGITEIIVAKHRNGPTGAVKLYFRDYVARFESLARPRQ